MKRYILLVVACLLLSSNGMATPYLPPNIQAIVRNQSSLLAGYGKIVDGAGYSMHNTAFSLDLINDHCHVVSMLMAMQANSPVDGERMGTVTLEPYTNGQDQKWGTSFYGTNEVALSSGLNGRNMVSIYYPEGSSRDKARLYSFDTLSQSNLYRILNLETRLCLVASQSSPEEPILVEFGSCTEGNYTWLLRRTG